MKIEESKGVWVLCLYSVTLEEWAAACWFNCAKLYGPSAVLIMLCAEQLHGAGHAAKQALLHPPPASGAVGVRLEGISKQRPLLPKEMASFSLILYLL